MAKADNIFSSLVDKNLLIPYFRNAMLGNSWPDSYQIEVDSSPYYGAGDGYFHPSTHAVTTNFNQAGARFLFYLFHEAYQGLLIFEPRDLQSEMTLAMGSALHAVVQTQFIQAGLLKEEDTEVEYVLEEQHARGRIDMIPVIPKYGRVVTELKTQNSRSFSFQKEVKPEWDAQLSMGLYSQNEDEGVLLVLEAGHPYHMREYRVKRNDRLLMEIFDKFARVRESIARDTPPAHCCALGSPEMDKCPARYVCWLRDEVK
ncbi:Cas4 family exonuclease [Gordonia phage Pupper]|uniref:Cas4 family exonuclease n=1 Tax=Gordonia phage Pupper TaxID=2571249 RepID=A0A4Y6EJJ0_9CAUD|nr:exonuclease [Gordonia phage Pupper]QDF18642.1 Cas4 family exonuclease [Gordonia phage Pupper]QDF18874.1 Cas4 family exonuclease [Gordonia phage SCentae]